MAVKRRMLVEYPVNSSESISVSGTAVGIAASANAKRGGALFTNEGPGDVRWRADGTSPTDSVGHTLADGAILRVYDSSTVRSMEFIAISDEQDATIFVSHMG